MMAKQGIDLWVKEIVLRSHFIATCLLVKVVNRFLCLNPCVKVSRIQVLVVFLSWIWGSLFRCTDIKKSKVLDFFLLWSVCSDIPYLFLLNLVWSRLQSLCEGQYDLSGSSLSIMNLGALIFDADILRNVKSWWIFFLWSVCSDLLYLFWLILVGSFWLLPLAS